MFYKLALRAFPNWFKPDSIYAHYPMTIPAENKVIMESLGRESDYSWDRPAFIPPRKDIFAYHNVRHVLGDQDIFHVMWGEATGYVFGNGGYDFMLSGDTSFHASQRRTMDNSLYTCQWHKHVKEFYITMTEKLLKDKSCRLGRANQVDITRE